MLYYIGTTKHEHPFVYEKGNRTMFKKFLQRIINSKNREDAVNKVFYGVDGIDAAFQKEKITWNEHQMLLAIINKMA